MQLVALCNVLHRVATCCTAVVGGPFSETPQSHSAQDCHVNPKARPDPTRTQTHSHTNAQQDALCARCCKALREGTPGAGCVRLVQCSSGAQCGHRSARPSRGLLWQGRYGVCSAMSTADHCSLGVARAAAGGSARACIPYERAATHVECQTASGSSGLLWRERVPLPRLKYIFAHKWVRVTWRARG